MTFYFAWVGSPPIPSFTLTTVGDVWGGSWETAARLWSGELSTTGDIIKAGTEIANLRNVDGLAFGAVYELTSGSEAGLFVYDGATGGSISGGNFKAAAKVSLKLVNPSGRTNVDLYDPSGLTVGETYFISGSGIPQNTEFTYGGTNAVVINNPATSNAAAGNVTITSDFGRDVITVADATGLEVGEAYQVFGKGLSAATLATYEGGNLLSLSQLATISTKVTLLKIHRGIVYPDGGPFDQETMARFDERVISVKIDHSEGNFPLLTIDLKNPNVGLLAPSRNVWCWLSWQRDDDNPIIPLFHGRLIGVPADLHNEVVTLQFIAQPVDYASQQAVISESLRVPPYYDPIWLTNGIDDATTILEARTALWHTDRVTLQASISDTIIGEDGVLEVAETDHKYADMQIKYGNPPRTSIYVTGTVSWSQEDQGEIDITREMVSEFKQAGSSYPYPLIGSLTGDGLLKSWPAPNSSIGGGWTVGGDSSATEATWVGANALSTKYVSRFSSNTIEVATPWTFWRVVFPVTVLSVNFTIEYQAKRDWTETVSFFLESDVQAVVTDSRASVETLSLSSSIITKPIDPDGQTPLRDKRFNSYFKTDRGQQSFQFLLAYAAAKLRFAARAVTVSFVTRWETALGLSCRWNATLLDRRLPGGRATGKVTSYSLQASARDGMRAIVVIGCSIGRGGTLTATEGAGAYVEDDYVDDGYQTITGGTVDIGDGSIVYSNFDDFIVQDDGIDFFNLTPANVIKSLVVSGGMRDQAAAIAATKEDLVDPFADPLGSFGRPPSPQPDPVNSLKNAYTTVALSLKPVAGGAFHSEFAVDVSTLKVPKTIDLELA